MKKMLFLPFMLLMLLAVSACGNNNNANTANNAATGNSANAANNGTNASGDAAGASAQDTDASGNAQADNAAAATGTITYQSETGPVEVPAAPKRIIALTNAPNVLSLDGTIVGVDEWTNKNPLFTEKLKGVEVVSDESLEKIIELNPDLIIAGSYNKNLDKLKEIAPTIVYTWGKLDYLNQQIEIGKLLNKEKEAQAWVDDFKQRAAEAGKEIKAKIGENATVSVMETDAKAFYVFGDNWARGTELIYQAMGLKMPEKVKADALGPGYYTLSSEQVGTYAGDYLVLSRSATGDNSFMKTAAWKNIPAVKNGHVIEIDTEASSYSDPTTLEYLLDIFKKGFLK
ncbi:iron-hydroxamate ABC transporter substrate-binding protein [Paenibacillus lycopersici]|uniref:Iron-hydroxamate ABC transporter substrate-binding protein n=1 Tax=Paenibacillus lycopersici TaxID=2704462 RepID=A0A6C0G361_9BACL|nr:iron-hydroxamate ABC transporter substrate-binding protein [Paenibacillus lycopersici]QHT61794.1 iron-hydroxamate ABC transporter substrate-binding protein [Paenibacillus lycopersici]